MEPREWIRTTGLVDPRAPGPWTSAEHRSMGDVPDKWTQERG